MDYVPFRYSCLCGNKQHQALRQLFGLACGLINWKNDQMILLKSRLLNKRTAAMALYPFILVNPRKKFGPVLLNHERIHLRQELELLIIPFYIIYLAELVVKGYRNVSFEREAYDNEHNPNYLKERKAFAWRKYWRKNKK